VVVCGVLLSLRRKTYLVVGLTLLVAVVVIFVVSQTVFMRGFARVETAEVEEQVKRARAAVSQNLAELSAGVFSYSSWDDTVAFLKDKNQVYIDANLLDSLFTGFKANMAIFVRNDGTVVWGRGFDLSSSKASSLPPGLSKYLAPDGPLVRHLGVDSKLSGILMLPDGPMLVNSQPILTSNGEGPVRGAFVMGRWLDAARTAELSSQTRLALSVFPLSAQELPVEVREAAAVAPDGQTVVIPLGQSTVTGCTVLADVFGQPALVLRVEMARAVYAQGTESVRYFMLALVAVVLVFGLVTNRLLERSLFRRLAHLTAQVRHVRPTQGKAAPIAVGGKDELALLAQTINAGFSQIESSRTQQEKQARSLAETLEELKGRHRDLEKAHGHLQQLQEVSASLGGSLEIKDALAQLESAALDIFEADEVWLLRLRPDQQELEGLRAFFRNKPGYARLPKLFGCDHPDMRLPQEANRLLRAVFHGSDAIFVRSLAELEPAEQNRLFGGSLPDLGGFHSLAVVPLFAEDLPVGLAISASARPNVFSGDRKSTTLLFASQVAQALKNTRLYEEIKALGEFDSLSGLYNRRRALEQLEIEAARARRYQGTFSVLIADIDNFKLFNDTYGHPVGDEIIRRVAGLLQHRSRSSDFVGRFGGDEFILILPETYRAGAATVADHLRVALGSMSYVAPDGASIPLRMSFGAASFPEDGQDAASLIAMADANLYESKRWGGDTVTVRREPISGETVDSGAFSTLDALVSAVDNKDHYTRRHSAQVAEQTAAIARSLGFSKEKQEVLRVASLLHDVGKIALPDRILRKPGALTSEEAEAMKQHSLIGSMMIAQHLPDLDDVREAVASHHERWNGTGYPAGLQGRDIPPLGRILAVADAHSAMTTDRPYRAALSRQEAIAELMRGSGSQFDPEVVRVFVGCLAGGSTPTPAPGTAGPSEAC
jgi:diguanylate cyclase (GGDEF)-like protein/putative nucleotidyltransferase with HDIG domain